MLKANFDLNLTLKTKGFSIAIMILTLNPSVFDGDIICISNECCWCFCDSCSQTQERNQMSDQCWSNIDPTMDQYNNACCSGNVLYDHYVSVNWLLRVGLMSQSTSICTIPRNTETINQIWPDAGPSSTTSSGPTSNQQCRSLLCLIESGAFWTHGNCSMSTPTLTDMNIWIKRALKEGGWEFGCVEYDCHMNYLLSEIRRICSFSASYGVSLSGSPNE